MSGGIAAIPQRVLPRGFRAPNTSRFVVLPRSGLFANGAALRGFRTYIPNAQLKGSLGTFLQESSFRTIGISADRKRYFADFAKSSDPPPTIQHYLEMKARYPDFVLLYRVGDFFEMFYEDAIKAAKALDITLTRYRKDPDIPMAGIPSHALDNYVERLIKKGILVAVCDQVEEMSMKKNVKGRLAREITRLVTPGTLVEERFLHPRKSNYLASISRDKKNKTLGLAWMDLSTGEFQIASTSYTAIENDLGRIQPSELLLTEDVCNDPALREMFSSYHLTVLQYEAADADPSARLKQLYGVESSGQLGDISHLEMKASDLLLQYLEITQIDRMPRLSAPQRFTGSSAVMIDSSTRKSLELLSNFEGEKKDSLLSVLDRTVTGPGARLLMTHLNAPLMDISEIDRRLDSVAFFTKNKDLIESIRGILKKTYDMKRCLQRLYLGRGQPRDIASIGATLSEIENLKAFLSTHQKQLPELMKTYMKDFSDHSELLDVLARALVDDPSQAVSDGGFIAEGYSKELDTLRTYQTKSETLLHQLQLKYRQKANIANLKIKKNGIIGYFIEVQPISKAKVPADFQLYQTSQTAIRYKTAELRELEDKINTAADKSIELEKQLFQDLVTKVCDCGETITQAAMSLAGIDVASSLALLAIERNYTRPIVNDSLNFKIVEGRHPTVEAIQGDNGSSFIGNDCDLMPEKHFWLVTGPNMGGKSTFLRQNAIIAILAQIGSFVPAKSAEIGVVDAIFSRIGSADDITHDKSTFMVEMIESARILNNATSRSLVIMDEVGRGTSTYDGLSIAWAVVEHLYRNECRSLFATHYHELTELETKHEKLACKTLAIKEVDGQVVFLYRIISGTSDKSYGIHVAALAGMPASVTKRAKTLLKQLLEKSPKVHSKEISSNKPSQVEASLQEINVDDTTPRQALQLLYDLKQVIASRTVIDATTEENIPEMEEEIEPESEILNEEQDLQEAEEVSDDLTPQEIISEGDAAIEDDTEQSEALLDEATPEETEEYTEETAVLDDLEGEQGTEADVAAEEEAEVTEDDTPETEEPPRKATIVDHFARAAKNAATAAQTRLITSMFKPSRPTPAKLKKVEQVEAAVAIPKIVATSARSTPLPAHRKPAVVEAPPVAKPAVVKLKTTVEAKKIVQTALSPKVEPKIKPLVATTTSNAPKISVVTSSLKAKTSFSTQTPVMKKVVEQPKIVAQAASSAKPVTAKVSPKSAPAPSPPEKKVSSQVIPSKASVQTPTSKTAAAASPKAALIQVPVPQNAAKVVSTRATLPTPAQTSPVPTKTAASTKGNPPIPAKLSPHPPRTTTTPTNKGDVTAVQSAKSPPVSKARMPAQMPPSKNFQVVKPSK